MCTNLVELHESLNLPVSVSRSEIVGVTILAKSIGTVNVTELKVLAGALDIVVDHVNEDSTAEQALLLQDLIDQVELVANGLLLLLSELRLGLAFTTESASYTSLDGERLEHVREASKKGLLFLLIVDHREFPFIVVLVFKEITHLDVVDLTVALVDVRDGLGDLGVSGVVTFDVRSDALTMESMLAWVDKELAIVEDCSEADVTVLSRIDLDVPVLLVASLGTQELGVLRVLLDLSAQIDDLLLIVIEAVAQMVFHVTDFGFLREKIEEIFDLEHVVLTNNRQSFLNLHLLIAGVLSL